MWSALSSYVDPEDLTCSDARRRLLARLGEYAELIVRPLNLRPSGATLLSARDERVEVRISTPLRHVVLALAPEGDLAGEIFWLRSLAASSLPIPQLIAYDLSCAQIPFTYAIVTYVGGLPLDRLEDGPRVRVLARQVGRTLRRAHQAAAPGFGAFDLELAPPTRAALAAAAARSGVTLGTLLQAAWALLITRHTGCTDVVFGVVGSGRELPVAGIDEVIGLFVVTQPLRVDTRETRREGANLPQWLSALQQQAALARQHEAVPASAAARAAALPPGQPLFETLFVLWNFPGLDEAPPGPLAIRPTHYRTVPAYPLTLVAVPTERLQLRLVHDRQRFDEAAIAQLAQTLQELLLALARGQDPRAAAQGATHG